MSRKLLYSHRNSPGIRDIDGWFLSHHFRKKECIPMEDELKLSPDQLPEGALPLWYEAPKGYPKREVLEKITESEEISGLSVTVIYDQDRDEGAEKFCQEKGWKYREWQDMMGCEDECIIALDCLMTESISRPHNLLVLVTTSEPKTW